MAKTFIRKTCPCNEYPLKPHFYIVKMGYAGVYYTIFLNLGPKHRSWILVRSEVVLRCTHDLCFEKKKIYHYIFLLHLLIAGCDIGVQISVSPSVKSVNIYVEILFSLCN